MSHTRSYSNRWWNRLPLAILLFNGPGLSARESTAPDTVVEAACTPSEKWTLGPLAEAIPADIQAEFNKFLSGVRQPFAAFAEIVALRQVASNPQVAAFVDYWLGRTLYSIGLYSESAIYFDQLISVAPRHNGLSIQMAAMACLQKVHVLAPQVELSKRAIANIPAFYEPWLVPKRERHTLYEATVHYGLSAIKASKADAVDDAQVLLEGSGPYEKFVQALWAIEQQEMDVAVSALSQLLTGPKLPESLAKRKNELLLILASAKYALEDYKSAGKYLEQIDKRSNELVQSQALLASVQIMTDNVSKSLGTAAVLKSDSFRTTFAPEAFTTISMGLIEFCRYPEARSNLSDFRNEYESSYRWLKRQINEEEGRAEALYPLAVDFMEGKDVPVPARVASEWIRSPIFISHQAAMNAVFQSARTVDRLGEGVRAARAIAIEELKEAEEIFKEASSQTETKKDPKDAGLLTLAVQEGAVLLAKARLGHLERAEPLWIEFLSRHRKNADQETMKLRTGIESHLKRVTVRMHAQLNRVIENNEVVEAELLGSASQDMVIQSTDPAPGVNRLPAGGSQPSKNEARGAEVWEDELGVSDVTIQDKCVKKKGSVRRKKL